MRTHSPLILLTLVCAAAAPSADIRASIVQDTDNVQVAQAPSPPKAKPRKGSAAAASLAALAAAYEVAEDQDTAEIAKAGIAVNAAHVLAKRAAKSKASAHRSAAIAVVKADTARPTTTAAADAATVTAAAAHPEVRSHPPPIGAVEVADNDDEAIMVPPVARPTKQTATAGAAASTSASAGARASACARAGALLRAQ